MTSPNQRFVARFALGTLVFNLAVIEWGAYVRASGSGAGCGDHWPTCNGDLIPRPERIETLIEFTHRATSGMALLATVALLVLAMRAFPARHRARRAAGATMVFMLGEAAVGAVLVLLQLVAHNDSVARAGVMGLHLVNTFLLLAGYVLTTFWAAGGGAVRLRQQGKVGLLLGLTLASMLVLGASGGITALGDTLFPAGTLAEGIVQDFSPTAHLLLRLRIFHPLIAIGTALLAGAAAFAAAARERASAVRQSALVLVILVGAQLLLGVVNLLLLAPVWAQLLHLLMADLVWMSAVLLAARTLSQPGEGRP